MGKLEKNPAQSLSLETQIRYYNSRIAWPSVLLAAALILTYTATIGAVILEAIPLALGVIILASIYHGVYTIMHECAHGNIHNAHSSAKWINNSLGYICGQIMCVSFKAHQIQHLKNHQHRPVDEGEKAPSNQNTGRIATHHLAKLGLLKTTWQTVKRQYQDYFSSSKASNSRRDQRIVIAELIIMIIWRGAFVAFGFYWAAIGLFIISTAAGALLLVILFDWLVHPMSNGSAVYKSTITYLFPKRIHKLMTGLWCYQNYHLIHHLFPQVPFYKYRSVFENMEDVLIANQSPIIRPWTRPKLGAS